MDPTNGVRPFELTDLATSPKIPNNGSPHDPPVTGYGAKRGTDIAISNGKCTAPIDKTILTHKSNSTKKSREGGRPKLAVNNYNLPGEVGTHTRVGKNTPTVSKKYLVAPGVYTPGIYKPKPS